MTSYNKQKRILISWGNEMKAEGREEGRAEGREESKEKVLSVVRDYFSKSGFSEDLQKEVLNDITLAIEKS